MAHNHTSETWTKEDQANSEPDFYGKWVSVENRLPVDKPDASGFIRVLVCGDVYVGERMFNSKTLRFQSCSSFTDCTALVTHWMIMPGPPKAS